MAQLAPASSPVAEAGEALPWPTGGGGRPISARAGGREMALGGSRHGGEAIWGGGEDRKLTRRSVHDGATRVRKHDDDDAVRGQGRPVPGSGSIRVTLGSLRRWQLG
jgi:hypothetical protein